MYHSLKLLLLLPVVFTCVYSQTRKPNSTPQTPVLVTKRTLTDSMPNIANVNAIEFFGIKLMGEYADIIDRMYQLPILSCIEQRDSVSGENNNGTYFSHIVEFCGVRCGMNVRYNLTSGKDIAIYDINFVTSQTEESIINKFVSELTKYYGNPDISDDREDSYHWYLPNKLCIRARHLHAPEGGWTVSIFIRK